MNKPGNWHILSKFATKIWQPDTRYCLVWVHAGTHAQANLWRNNSIIMRRPTILSETISLSFLTLTSTELSFYIKSTQGWKVLPPFMYTMVSPSLQNGYIVREVHKIEKIVLLKQQSLSDLSSCASPYNLKFNFSSDWLKTQNNVTNLKSTTVRRWTKIRKLLFWETSDLCLMDSWS